MAASGLAKKIRSSHRWTGLSQYIREVRPMCELCVKRGIYKKSQEVHHILGVEDYPHLAFNRENLMALCHECHLKAHNRKPQKKKEEKQHVNEGWEALLRKYG